MSSDTKDKKFSSLYAMITIKDGRKTGSDTEPEFTTNVQFVQVMSGSNRRDWTPAFPDDHSHDGMKRDSRYYYPRNHLL